MGSGSSVATTAAVHATLDALSAEDLRGALADLPPEARDRLRCAVDGAGASLRDAPAARGREPGGAAGDAAPGGPSTQAAPPREGPPPREEVGAEAARPPDTQSATAAPPAGEGDIPPEWGWPAQPHDVAVLRQYVLEYTKASKQDEWNEALAARSVGGTQEDHVAERAFANLLLNKEGTGEEKDERGVDPNAYKAGKWYRFLNAKGDCHVYVHNYTLGITASKPDNFNELTPEEKARLKRLGVFIKELPDHLVKIYDKQQQIPIVFGSVETCEALKKFAIYDKNSQLLDATMLRKVNPHALEESRKAIVNAMKLGLMLYVYLGDTIPDLQEKVCISKNANTFPFNFWTYGGLDNNMTKKKIYRPEDVEAGQYVVRPGFRICVVLAYDNMNLGISSMRKEEMPMKIPNFHHMEQVRCYAEHDIGKLLADS